MATIELKSGIIGTTAVPISSVYGETAAQKFALGSVYFSEDGRKFRYAKNGAVALGSALMCQAPVEIANHKNVAIGTAAAAGATSLLLSTTLSTTVTKDQYKDGYITIGTGTGIGQCYRIKGHNAGGGASDDITIELYDAVVVGIAANATVTLKANPWNGVLVAATSMTGIPVGVPLIPVTIGYYCWLQVQGPAPMTVDTGDTVVLGANVGKPGTQAVAGTCGVVGTTGADTVYGQCMTVGAADATALVMLNIG